MVPGYSVQILKSKLYMKPEKVLLVDDDSAFNFLNRIIINTAGLTCEIDECLDGTAALKYITNTNKCPDVILLDINMPVMDGFEFLEEFDKNEKCKGITKVFMLTSSNQDEDRVGALKYNCVKGYFDKPLTEEHIREIVSSFEHI
jgi:CheY-like chemotaxis protein